MSDQERFLERWSRRKREAESTAGAEPNPESERNGTEPARGAATTSGAEQHAPPPAAPFDLASLPPIDSIMERADVRAFLAPGVPPDLTRAALRRLWTADPAIRDFVGLQEYDWDFTDPGGIAGFGDLPADLDVEKLVRQVFGQPDERPEAASDRGGDATAESHVQHAQIADESGPQSDQPAARALPDDERVDAEMSVGATQTEDSGNVFVHRNDDAAMQERHPTQPEQPASQLQFRRRHGGALPEV